MNRKINWICALWCLLFGWGVQAQDAYSVEDTVKIDEVVITGTPVQVRSQEVPMAVSVLSRNEIENSGESALLPILNGRIPGLFVTQRGVTGFGVAKGSAGQISMRGIGGNPTTGVLILIDGHPQFMGIMGHPLPDAYVASDVERVEVIRGPASVLYGSNAMGGVINIITRKPQTEGMHGNVRVLYGGYNTQKYMASAALKGDKASVLVSANRDKTDGHRPNADFEINNGYVKLGYKINSNFSASTDFSLAAYKASDPGPDTLGAVAGEKIDIHRGYWSALLHNNFGRVSGDLKLFYNFGEHKITDGFHSNDYNWGLNFFESLRIADRSWLTAGFDWMNYGGDASNELAMAGRGITFADTSITEYGLYLFSKNSLGNHLFLNAGLRYHHHSVYGSEWVPTVGLAWEKKGNNLKATASKGFRSPTMRELFMWGPNPDLMPESVWNYELGWSSSFFQHALATELTLFHVEGDNQIVNVGPPAGFLNTGEISNSGAELVLKARLSRHFNANATYSYIHMKEALFATPEHHLFLGADYRIKALSIHADMRYVAGMDNDAGPLVNRVNYWVANAKLTYDLLDQLQVFVKGENLFDENYSVNRYYTMPGRFFLAGINFRY